MTQSKTISKEKTAASGTEVGVYKVNEVYSTLQGEGRLHGKSMIFVRFAGCNLRCSVRNAGFDCDTQFKGGRPVSKSELLEEIDRAESEKRANWVCFTGGEPGLQLDNTLIHGVMERGYKISVETNGTRSIPLRPSVDWLTVSPKSAWHTIKRYLRPDELKLVRQKGQSLPDIDAIPLEPAHLTVSPAWIPGTGYGENLEYCINLVRENPQWSLTVQLHKIIGLP